MREILADHPFFGLSAEERWTLCHVARNRLPHYLRVQMVPLQLIQPAKIRNFTQWFFKKVNEDVDDVTIVCSASPVMYVRMEKSQGDEIKMIKIAFRDPELQLPNIWPRSI